MIVSFVCPAAPSPLGGVNVLYEYANGLARRGHEVHIAHGEFWGRPGIASVEELTWVRFEPSVVHHFGSGEIRLPEADVIFGTGAPPELGLPVLLIQGFEMFPRAMERAVFRTPCLKICVASWLRSVGLEFGVPPQQIVHVRMGIDLDAFRMQTALDSRQFHVGMLYSSHPAKGFAPGLQALEQVRAGLGELRAIMFSTEQPEDELPEWVTFRRDPDRRALIDEIYSECRVFVQPSMYEGFGLTAVEAMACGCALVSTDNGGSRDYAIAGQTALLADPGDVAGLAEGVDRLLRDDGERTRLATNGQSFVQRFRWDRAVEDLEGHLERYIASPAEFQQAPVDDADPQAIARHDSIGSLD